MGQHHTHQKLSHAEAQSPQRLKPLELNYSLRSLRL